MQNEMQEEVAFFIHFQKAFYSLTTPIDYQNASLVYQVIHQLCKHSVTDYTCANLCKDVEEALKGQPPKPPTPRPRPTSAEVQQATAIVPRDDDRRGLNPGQDLAAQIASLISEIDDLKDQLQHCQEENARLELALISQLPEAKIHKELEQAYDTARKTEKIAQQNIYIKSLLAQIQRIFMGTQSMGTMEINVTTKTGQDCKGELHAKDFLERFTRESKLANDARPNFAQAREALQDVKQTIGSIANAPAHRRGGGGGPAFSSYYY